MANLMKPREGFNMDDRAASKVIAAIERLSNRIAKLDETSVESAAIANEARRAAMDAAEATNPKQTAKFLSERVNPVLRSFETEFRSTTKGMDDALSGILRESKVVGARFNDAYGDAAFVAHEHERRSRNLLIATAMIGFSVVTITLLSAWILHDQMLRSRAGCEVFGGIYKWTVSNGSYCIIGAS